MSIAPPAWPPGVVGVGLLAAVVPALDGEQHTMPGDVVLDADDEALASGVPEAAGPLGVEVVQGGDPQAAVGQEVVVLAVVEAIPQVVVAANRRAIAVLVQDHVPGARL